MKRLLVTLVLASSTAAACSSEDSATGPVTVGNSASSGGTNATSGAGGAAACSPELPSIEKAIFAISCSMTSCHNPTDAAGELDLATPGLESRLVDVASASCKALRVAPSKPEESLLYQKSAQEKPVCGDRMPVGAALSEQELGCVRDWIASLTGGCETCGTSACVDVQSNSAHCGACANACKAGISCKAGARACDNGGVDCAEFCKLTAADPKNCGQCGKACQANEVGLDSACSGAGCGALTQCGGSCVDTTSDSMHCGAKETCTGSKCVCPGAKDLKSDPVNCGGCGVACKGGESCISASAFVAPRPSASRRPFS
ncbi:MAG: hypothetical protein FJ095_06605 [Deltaproteobacteria bacterium]|nr:hypothetical protein [Deltaproteobacteria bacterium]